MTLARTLISANLMNPFNCFRSDVCVECVTHRMMIVDGGRMTNPPMQHMKWNRKKRKFRLSGLFIEKTEKQKKFFAKTLLHTVQSRLLQFSSQGLNYKTTAKTESWETKSPHLHKQTCEWVASAIQYSLVVHFETKTKMQKEKNHIDDHRLITIK